VSKKRKAFHFTSGIALGTIVAAGATFLYKTKKGKKLKKQFQPHINNAKGFLTEHVKDIQKQAKKLEATLEERNQEVIKQTKKTKRQVKKTTDTVRKKVFLKSGKPLAK